MAQVVYYFATWPRTGGDDPVSFTVSSSNFSNITAGHIARLMGLPIRHLVLVISENDVLDELFHTSVYRPRAMQQTHIVNSSSMDTSKASNFGRFIADLLGRDGMRVANLFGRELPGTDRFDLSSRDRDRFGSISGPSAHASRLTKIHAAWGNDRVLTGPHTADGVHAARRSLTSGEMAGPAVVLGTALPVELAETITQATSIVPPCPDRFAGVESLSRRVTCIPADVDAVRQAIDGAA